MRRWVSQVLFALTGDTQAEDANFGKDHSLNYVIAVAALGLSVSMIVLALNPGWLAEGGNCKTGSDVRRKRFPPAHSIALATFSSACKFMKL